jgi:hypothetical protein
MFFYEGPMQYHKMEREAVMALRSYDKQRSRCYNPKQKGYKNYGGKGIEVRYSAREFVGWWIHNINHFKGEKPTVGRIDHDKDYCFENIIIQSRSENSREVYERLGKAPIKNKIVVSFLNGKKEKIFNSCSDAARYYNISQQYVSLICRGKRDMTKNGLKFIYLED